MMAVQVIDAHLDCQKCDDRLKADRGCHGNARIPFFWGDDKLVTCPFKLITAVTWEYLNAYAFYKKDMLPNGSAWRYESQKFLDAMYILDDEVRQREQKEMKKNGGK